MMLVIDNVAKSYGSGESLVRAVDGVSMEILQGEFVMITGHSGSGKTTLLNIIGGMSRPDAGDVLIDGKSIMTMDDREISIYRARHIGFIFQFQSMISTLNAVENVLLASVFSGVRLKSDEAIAMLGKVGLSGRKNAFSSQLSSGQQRRVAVARALVHGPKLLLCDEPTGDLDPETEEAVMKLIKDASSSGATVVMATHNHDLLKYCTKNIRLSGGRVA